MRCLWLTRIDPEPADTGELIYSAEMINAFAGAGAELTVLCLAGPQRARREGPDGSGIEWRIVDAETRPSWQSVLSPLPNLAYRCALRAFGREVRSALENGDWDVVAIDSLATGWALEEVARAARGRSPRTPRIVYVSHNHEETTRVSVAREIGGSALRRAALHRDARKAARLERRLVDRADLVTAISPRDLDLYAGRRQGRPLIELTPGYRGRRREIREITEGTPRRVVMVGSYEWGAKRENLREFLRTAAGPLDVAGIELTVVGKGGESLVDSAGPASVTFTGRVDDVYAHLDNARIAVIPERLGGGFKLKALEYVFNRMPIAALCNSFPGVPLVNGGSVLSYPDFRNLTAGLISVMDDLPTLNRLQQSAFETCSGLFDWESRGKRLFEAVSAL